MAIEIRKDDKIVPILVAQAKHERVDSNDAENLNKVVAELVANPNPNNMYQIGQLVGFTVNELMKPRMNFLDTVADVKHVGFGEKAEFQAKMEGIRAYIQAKGSTTPRSKVANKTVILDTVNVSARPVINWVELKANRVNMADLVVDAAYQMELAEIQYFTEILTNAARNWTAPYYASGTGIVASNLDPVIRFWARAQGGGGAVLWGDIDITSQLGELTGFTAAANSKQFADDLILEQNRLGYVGVYKGARVINAVNPLIDGTDKNVLNRKLLYIFPSQIDASMRPLKAVFEGDVESQEQRHIDDKSFEIRLDQLVGGGIAYGERPYMSVYEDTSN